MQPAKKNKPRPTQIRRSSSTNTFQDSFGNRYTSKQIDEKIRQAKLEFQKNFIEEHGYIFCEQCKKEFDEHRKHPQPGCEIIDISHTVSIKKAKETGRTELCWDWRTNFRHLGRRHHNIHDKLY